MEEHGLWSQAWDLIPDLICCGILLHCLTFWSLNCIIIQSWVAPTVSASLGLNGMMPRALYPPFSLHQSDLSEWWGKWLWRFSFLNRETRDDTRETIKSITNLEKRQKDEGRKQSLCPSNNKKCSWTLFLWGFLWCWRVAVWCRSHQPQDRPRETTEKKWVARIMKGTGESWWKVLESLWGRCNWILSGLGEYTTQFHRKIAATSSAWNFTVLKL